MTKALGLISGGLDSILATVIIKEQEISIVAMNFKTPFVSPDRAVEAAKKLNVSLKILDITPVFLETLRNPKHGYGSGMNPCIDCHVLMLQQAGGIMEKEGFDFMFTGDVLGQRPMSQHKGTLRLIDKESGHDGYILRPLSAKLLPKSIPEENGQVDRNKLLDIRGRSRKRQMALARGYGISEYPAPAGGCLLTDPIFSRRLKDLFDCQLTVAVRDIELLKWGRHFRLDKGNKLIVGRDKNDNEAICRLSRPGDQVLKVLGFPGPISLIPSGTPLENRELAASICASYSDAPEGQPVEVAVTEDHVSTVIVVEVSFKGCFQEFMI
jgi:tRNA-specific 2-thiouridylase